MATTNTSAVAKNAAASKGSKVNQTAPANTSNVTNIETGKVKKIDAAREVYAKITGDGYELKEASPRAEFLAIMCNQHGMTDKGASTYWQMLSTKAKGGELYAYGKQPTGNKPGRRPDPQTAVKKAAARVKALQDRVAKDQEELRQATEHLTEMVTGGAQAQA